LQGFRIEDGSRMRGTFFRPKPNGELESCLPSVRLLEMLDSLRGFDATDPRDRIFAILGLVERCNPTIKASSSRRRDLLPDYHLSTEKVYLNAAWYIMCQI
jgi:hypothetical protein